MRTQAYPAIPARASKITAQAHHTVVEARRAAHECANGRAAISPSRADPTRGWWTRTPVHTTTTSARPAATKVSTHNHATCHAPDRRDAGWANAGSDHADS